MNAGGVDVDWTARLHAAAAERLPAEVAQAWIGLFRPGIRLTTEGQGPRVAWLGGNPELPADVAWPVWPEHGPLNFVAGVDLAALPKEHLSIPLPSTGTLLFFYFDGERQPGYPDPAFLEDFEGSRVLFIPAGAEVAERPAPETSVPYPRLDLVAEVVATGPEGGHFLLERTLTAGGTPLRDAVATEVFAKLRWVAEDPPFHQVGGFAAPIQDAVESDAAGLAHQASWSLDRFFEEAARWVLLAQFDSDERAEMNWCGLGRLYWVIRAEDLVAGRFEAARCVVQSS